eukprot:7447825-Alexandrium_andersonii.AAC.1
MCPRGQAFQGCIGFSSSAVPLALRFRRCPRIPLVRRIGASRLAGSSLALAHLASSRFSCRLLVAGAAQSMVGRLAA